MKTENIIESEQLINTPSENIKHFEINGNTVKAVFYSASDAARYIKEYSAFTFSPNWYDKIGFADFTIKRNIIEAHSTYHTTSSMIDMFKSGLKNW
jgi:hypothetical protein